MRCLRYTEVNVRFFLSLIMSCGNLLFLLFNSVAAQLLCLWSKADGLLIFISFVCQRERWQDLSVCVYFLYIQVSGIVSNKLLTSVLVYSFVYGINSWCCFLVCILSGIWSKRHSSRTLFELGDALLLWSMFTWDSAQFCECFCSLVTCHEL